MDKAYYKEMKAALCKLSVEDDIKNKKIFIFGHCNATEKLADLFLAGGYKVNGILDNNVNKQGGHYRNIEIVAPEEVLKSIADSTIVCIASKAYATMAKQLIQMGYEGRIEKIIDFNSFAEYSLSEDTIEKKEKRLEAGMAVLHGIKEKYKGEFLVICPYSALGDVYYTMAYLSYYLEKKAIKDYAVIVVGNACKEVTGMFDVKHVEKLNQKNMDELVQAVLFSRDEQAFIAHHDRPYTSQLIKVLEAKFIRFEDLYRMGVFGLEKNVAGYIPTRQERYEDYTEMIPGRSVILAPYAKSVVGVSHDIWGKIVDHYKAKNYRVYTNVAGEELPIARTIPINASLQKMRSVVEYAGTFIGIRSGLCDVLKEADCRKIALYPNCYYSDTRWKVADFFELEGWENIVV